MSHPIITLLTDFGTRDHYVASMKGVILGINPECTLVDISHQVGPQDIEEGAFVLANAVSSFPRRNDSSLCGGSRCRRAQKTNPHRHIELLLSSARTTGSLPFVSFEKE